MYFQIHIGLFIIRYPRSVPTLAFMLQSCTVVAGIIVVGKTGHIVYVAANKSLVLQIVRTYSKNAIAEVGFIPPTVREYDQSSSTTAYTPSENARRTTRRTM